MTPVSRLPAAAVLLAGVAGCAGLTPDPSAMPTSNKPTRSPTESSSARSSAKPSPIPPPSPNPSASPSPISLALQSYQNVRLGFEIPTAQADGVRRVQPGDTFQGTAPVIEAEPCVPFIDSLICAVSVAVAAGPIGLPFALPTEGGAVVDGASLDELAASWAEAFGATTITETRVDGLRALLVESRAASQIAVLVRRGDRFLVFGGLPKSLSASMPTSEAMLSVVAGVQWVPDPPTLGDRAGCTEPTFSVISPPGFVQGVVTESKPPCSRFVKPGNLLGGSPAASITVSMRAGLLKTVNEIDLVEQMVRLPTTTRVVYRDDGSVGAWLVLPEGRSGPAVAFWPSRSDLYTIIAMGDEPGEPARSLRSFVATFRPEPPP